jgi:SAM-dependent methyltransferase
MAVHQLGAMDFSDAALWLEVECGPVTADLSHWLALAGRADGTVVDVGAGIGRVSIPLAQAGHDVIAVEIDPDAVAALRDRARALDLVFDVALQDARDLWLPRRVPLIIVPCSTLQMLGPRADRARFLERAAYWLEPGGALAVALHDDIPAWGRPDGDVPPPDVVQRDGHRYESQIVGVRKTSAGWMDLLWERSVDGGAPVRHTDRLWRLSPRTLTVEARAHGLTLVSAQRHYGESREDALFVELRKAC